MGASSSRLAEGDTRTIGGTAIGANEVEIIKPAEPQAPMPVSPVESKRDFDRLVQEELALQAASIPASEIPSCLTLFDKWLACYALGVQFKNAYRFGTIADCAPRKEDFKFCLTLRAMDPETRRHEYLLRRAEEMAHT